MFYFKFLINYIFLFCSIFKLSCQGYNTSGIYKKICVFDWDEIYVFGSRLVWYPLKERIHFH